MSRRMQEVRRERKKSFYLRELSAFLSRLVQDEPAFLQVCFTRVELSPDGGQLYVYCSSMDGSGAEEGMKVFEGVREKLVLYKASLRKALAAAAAGRYVPDIRFLFDESKEKERRVTGLLIQVGEELEAYDEAHDPKKRKH